MTTRGRITTQTQTKLTIAKGKENSQNPQVVKRVAKPTTTARSNSLSYTKKQAPAANSIANVRKQQFAALQERIQTLEEQDATLTDAIEIAQQEIALRQTQIETLVTKNLTAQTQHECLTSELDSVVQQTKNAAEAQKRLQTSLQTMKESQELLLQAQKTKYESLQMNFEGLQRKQELTLEDLKQTRAKLVQQADCLKTLQAQKSTVQSSLQSTNTCVDERNLKIEQLQALLKTHQQQVAELEERSRQDELQRLVLYNSILDLKGTVRVFIRVGGSPDQAQQLFDYPDAWRGQTLTVKQASQESELLYEFDKVFGPSASEVNLFKDLSPMVKSALDGFNVCIFSYGQSSSPRADVMETSSDWNSISSFSDPTHDTLGIIPRAVEFIFASVSSLRAKGWTFTIGCSFFEIYSEEIFDLLQGGSQSTSIELVKADQVFGILRKAQALRAELESQCPQRLLKSTVVFQLSLKAENLQTSETTSGLLNLVTLPASEEKDNPSCLGLGKVITALANNDRPPFRCCKLTSLLQGSLGGTSKTMMLVSLSPRSEDISFTLDSLRFAKEVSSCNIGSRDNTKKKAK